MTMKVTSEKVTDNQITDEKNGGGSSNKPNNDGREEWGDSEVDGL